MRKSPLVLSKGFLFIIVCASMMLTDCSIKTQEIKRSFSQKPPLSLKVEQVPQFLVFGFDDNGFSGLDNSGGTGGVKFINQLYRQFWNGESGFYQKSMERGSFERK
jgi:hypothetical protein